MKEEPNGMLKADGFEGAMLGIAVRCGQPPLIAYSVSKCIEILVERDGMAEDEAAEYLEFNSIGAWAGEGTPLWIYDVDEDWVNDWVGA